MNVSLMSLWLPIVLSAVVVFIASSLIGIVVKYHDSEWKKLPDEEVARTALRGASPGQYAVPHAASAAGIGKISYRPGACIDVPELAGSRQYSSLL